MHELSMAQGIINTVLETSEANDATEVKKVVVEIGKLAMINPEQLLFMMNVLVEDTIMEDAKIEIVDIPVEIECAECGHKGNGKVDEEDHYAPMIECPKCESNALRILNGQDIIVKSIEIEKHNIN